VHGDKRGGRVLGFPTANISLDEDLIVPKNGVYAVSSTINGRNVWGMMNIGYRPTFNSRPDKSIEVNFLDFEGDLYDKNLTINIHEKLRSEKKFSAIEEMIAQLNKDKENVIKLYKSSQMS
jgi:riboflavin kinase/FMN adenylyltransferase